MKPKIDLSEINLSKILNRAGKTFNQLADFCKEHKTELTISSLFMFLGLDNIRLRLSRKKERKQYIDTTQKSIKVMKMHEAKIQSLEKQVSGIETQNLSDVDSPKSSKEDIPVE